MSLPGAPRPRSLALLALGLFGLSACGARYGQRVPDDVVEKLPYEARIELLEAENELAISVDRADEAPLQSTRTSRAQRPWRSCESRWLPVGEAAGPWGFHPLLGRW